MDHQPHVLFVHTHAKCRSGDHDLGLAFHEGILVFGFLLLVHFAVVGFSLIPISYQSVGKFFGFSRAGDIDDGRAVFFLDQIPKRQVFFLLVLLFKNPIVEVGPGSRGGEKLQF